MFVVMSAEEVDGHIEPFLHGMYEREKDAVRRASNIVKWYGVFDDGERDGDGTPKEKVKRGHNDQDKWTNKRWDSDGKVAWNTGFRPIGVFVKEVDMSRHIGLTAKG